MNALTDEALDAARQNFEFFDQDQNGYIDFTEFHDLLKVIAGEVTTQQAAEGFSMVDTDSDGRVSFEEFISWWQTAWYEF